MSHVTSSLAVCTDTDILCQVIADKFPKLTWHEGKKAWRWYGTWMQDMNTDQAAFRRGIDVSQYGKGEHCVSLEGCTYDIGIVKRKDGQGYSIVWDGWGSQGQKLTDYIGQDAGKLMAEYNEEFSRQLAMSHGMMINTTQDEDFTYMELMS